MGRGLWLVWTPRRAVGVEGRKDCNSCVLVCIRVCSGLMTYGHTCTQNLAKSDTTVNQSPETGQEWTAHTVQPSTCLPSPPLDVPSRPSAEPSSDGRTGIPEEGVPPADKRGSLSLGSRAPGDRRLER